MLLALSHHQSPRVSFVIYTRPSSLSPPIHALKLHTTSSLKYYIRAGKKIRNQEVCSDIENDLAEDLGGEVGQSEASLIG